MAGPRVYLTETASVRGKYQRAEGEGAPISAFLGVPYAQPPVAERRFLPPEPLQLWAGERDCTEFGAVCPQMTAAYDSRISHYPGHVMFDHLKCPVSEDCLVLNVWTPDTDARAALPVMVWIHGGGFTSGSGNLFDLTALAAINKVVAVSINYRLGIFGLATSGDDVIPGNAGILDQIEALRWIQRYISAFGGDPNNVTVFGLSAGGMSASLLLATDLARGLFRRVICMSGVANSIYVVRTRQQQLKLMEPGLQKLGYTGSSSEDLLHFLRSKTSQELLDAFTFGFKIVIDDHLLSDYPHNLYRMRSEQFRNADVISGYATDEAHFMVYMVGALDDVDALEKSTIRDNVLKAAQYGFSENVDAIADAMIEEYFPADIRSCAERTLAALMELYSDMTFVSPAQQFAEDHSGCGQHYLYVFDHRPSMSLCPDWVTSDHVDSIPYALGYPFLRMRDPETDVRYTDEERRLSQLVMRYFTNFARSGNPNDGGNLPEWPRFTADKRECFALKLNPDVTGCHSAKRTEFWSRVIPELDTSRSYM